MPRSERPQMAEYGVPTDIDGVLPWSWAEERLLRSKNFWLVTASVTARPHALPVWGVWLTGEERFVFSCAASSRKARNLTENPQLVITIDDTVECVSVEATATACDPTAVSTRSYAALYGEKYEPDPVKRAQLVEFFCQNSVWAATPLRAFGVIEREEEFAERATRWVW
jgi:hypothetical protein